MDGIVCTSYEFMCLYICVGILCSSYVSVCVCLQGVSECVFDGVETTFNWRNIIGTRETHTTSIDFGDGISR